MKEPTVASHHERVRAARRRLRFRLEPRSLLSFAVPFGFVLAASCGGDPKQRFGRAVERYLQSADEAAFRSGVADLRFEEPRLRKGLELGVPKELPKFPEPSKEPRLHILSPRGFQRHHDLEHNNLVVRWFDSMEKKRSPGSLSLRLFPAKKKAKGEPDLPRVLDEKQFLAENLLGDSKPQSDGSQRVLFASQWVPPGWLLLQIRDPLSPVRPETKIEDESWFVSAWSEGRDFSEFEHAKRALKELCDAAGLAPRASECLLARLLIARGLLLAAAQLLELMDAEKRGSPASAALLALAYRGLDRPLPGTPREPALRDDAAQWQDPYLPADPTSTKVKSGPLRPDGK